MTQLSTLSAQYWHYLNVLLDSELWKLLPLAQELGGPQEIFRTNENRLIQSGLGPSSIKKIIAGKNTIDPAKMWDKLLSSGIEAISQHDNRFPQRLKEIPKSPPIIYVRGDLALLQSESLAIVGSRKITSYGKQIVKELVPPITNLGLPIVSGMAFGIDSAALECCLDCGGKPIGVLASSLSIDEITPRANMKLAQRIIKEGCLVSENPPGRIVGKWHFPLRNRIVSGLSIGVIVAEASQESGSLITAKLALEQNREVFAVPGPIFSENSAGTLDLIRRGAKCVSSFTDIAGEFGWDIIKPMPRNLIFENKNHKLIYEALFASPAGLNDIIESTKLKPDEVLTAVTEMELNGVLQIASNGMYAKIK